MTSISVRNVIQLYYIIPGRFDSHPQPCFFRGGDMHMVSGLFTNMVSSWSEGSANLFDDLLSSRAPAAMGELVQHTPPHHTAKCIVHSRLRPHRARRFLEVHHLGEDDRIFA